MIRRVSKRARRVPALVAAGLAFAACGPEEDPPLTAERPLAVRIEALPDSTRLVLRSAAGWRINARLKPALETDGALFRFDIGRVTPDSAYFDEPPATVVPGRRRHVAGTLHASVCAAGEQVCRSVVLEVGGRR